MTITVEETLNTNKNIPTDDDDGGDDDDDIDNNDNGDATAVDLSSSS